MGKGWQKMREYRAAGEGLIVRSEAVFQTVLELEMIHRENRHGALRLKAVAGWTDEDLAQRGGRYAAV